MWNPFARKLTAIERLVKAQASQQHIQREVSLAKRALAMEAAGSSLWGDPVDLNRWTSFNGWPPQPIFVKDQFPWKATTLRQIQEFDRTRSLGRYLFETCPEAKAAVNGPMAFVLGAGLAAHVTSIREGKDVRLVEDVEQWLKQFDEINGMDGYEGWQEEFFKRVNVDGEVFARLFSVAGAPPRLTVEEPDYVMPPVMADWEGPWSFGCQSTNKWDAQNVVAYNFRYLDQPLDDNIVPISRISHLKDSPRKNVKRGLSVLYAIDDELRGCQRLRYALREGAKIRASIPYIRQHAMADQQTVQAMLDAATTSTILRTTGGGSSRNVNVVETEPGSVVDIPRGMEMRDPPAMTDWASAVEIYNLGLQSIASALQVPVWMISGTSKDSNYASSLVAESPFVKNIESQQGRYKAHRLDIYHKAIQISIDNGDFPEDLLERICVHVDVPEVRVRNGLELAKESELLMAMQIKSPQTVSAEFNVDFDEEQAKIKKAKELGWTGSKGVEPEKTIEKNGFKLSGINGSRNRLQGAVGYEN
jgi:hypothetical protein